VLKMPDVRTRLESQGVEIEYLPPAPFAELIRKDAQRMAKLVQDAGLVFE
jgi:tripartite-type tricarboxylate transporter receptor subunit TctC